jgi:hypothetical protein
MPFIDHQGRRSLFVHIPKTGGTSIETWLKGIGPLRLYRNGIPQALKVSVQHLTYTDIRLILGDDYFDYGFTIVRNPFRRLESEYSMRSDLATDGVLGRVAVFPVWVRTQIEMMQKAVFNQDGHFRPQIDYVSNHIAIFRFEEGIDSIIAHADMTPHSMANWSGICRWSIWYAAPMPPILKPLATAPTPDRPGYRACRVASLQASGHIGCRFQPCPSRSAR